MKALLKLLNSSQISSDLRTWLHAPDATVDHNAAYAFAEICRRT